MNIAEHLRKYEKLWVTLIGIVSVVVVGLVALLLYQAQTIEEASENIYILPRLNAVINSIVTVLLIIGYVLVRQKKFDAHKLTMLGAFFLSILFLISYVIYHNAAPHTEFGGEGLVRYFYFLILITHILLAIVIVPLALFTLMRAFQDKLKKHRKIAKITWPIWLYVSITGVLIYFMISPYYPV